MKDYSMAEDAPTYQMSSDYQHVAKILEALEKNGGYCPCRIDKSEDTFCPCKDFRTTGICHCGLYVSKEDTNEDY